MNTGSDECIIEDLTTLVGQDVGADEPDMSTNNLSYVDIEDLFSSYQGRDEQPQEDAIAEPVAFVSPLDPLKEIVLSLDWEMSTKNIERCLAEIELLLQRWQDDRHCSTLLKILSTIGKYLGTEQGNAHPDSIKVLTSVYVCLEKIVSALDMDPADKDKALADEVVKFKTLRQKIASQTQGQKPDGREDRKSQESDALLALKAMVLSIDWGEISQERIDAFFAEIAALKKRWQGDGTLVQGLEILRAYGQYIFVKKEFAHPDSFSQLFASYNSLERVLVSDHLTLGAKRDIISLELQKFITLKKQITAAKEGPQAASAATTPSPEAAPLADRQPSAQEVGAARHKALGGESASFLAAVDTRLDDFFAEKDATQAAALQVAELPSHATMPADDGGAPAAMVDDLVAPAAAVEAGPAMFMEEAFAPEESPALAAVLEEEPAAPAESPALATVLEEAFAPAESPGVSLLQEEALFHTDEEITEMVDYSAPLPSPPEDAGGEELMAEAITLTEEAGPTEPRGKTGSGADEIGRTGLSETLTEHDLKVIDDHYLAGAHDADATEVLSAEGIAGEKAAISAPAPSCPPWLDDLAAQIAGLQRQCSDTAVAAVRQSITTLSTARTLPPPAGIGLDLLTAVTTQLAVMAEADRSTGAALLASLCERIKTDLPPEGTGTHPSLLPTIQSLVHDFVSWQHDATRLTAGRYAADQASAAAVPPAAGPQPAEGTTMAEEATTEPKFTPETRPRRDRTAPADTFFNKIRHLFKK